VYVGGAVLAGNILWGNIASKTYKLEYGGHPVRENQYRYHGNVSVLSHVPSYGARERGIWEAIGHLPRGVPLSARTRPESTRAAQPAVAAVGPPARSAAPPVEIDRERRPPAEPSEQPILHRVPPTPAAVFAPPGVQERRLEREPVEIAPLPPEAPAPLAQPPRNPPPMMQEAEHRIERQSLGLRAAVAGEKMQDQRQPMRVIPEPVQRLDVEASVRTAAAAAARQLAAENTEERVGLWQARNGPRYEFFGPPRGPAEASPGTEADLDRWSGDRDPASDREPNGHANGIHGPTPEQISSLEQEMARLLGEIAGKRTS
jgi:hypothetical protein